MRHALFLCVLFLAACDVSEYETVNIAVYPSTKSCAIKDAPVDCAKLGAYLRDTLKIKPARDITVSYAGAETVEKGDTSVEQIAELLKTSGFTNVRAVRYEMK